MGQLKKVILILLGTIKRLFMYVSFLIPRSSKIYIFGSWYGEKFADNSRALFIYACGNTRKKCYWITKSREVFNQVAEQGYLVLMANSIKGIYYQLRAGVAFSSVGYEDFYRGLLGNCIHVELWHGVGGGKKIGMDDKGYRDYSLSLKGRYYSMLERIPLRKHYFVATSPEMKKVFMSAFEIKENNIILAGQARNDMFYDKEYIYQTLDEKFFTDKKIILYMPTHRKEGKISMKCDKLFDMQRLNDFCRRNHCVFVIKKHFYHREEGDKVEGYSNIVDITDQNYDTNELLMVADYLISDYSSVTADYLLLDRPIFYYCYDLKEYLASDRDLYWEYNRITPGSKSENFEELLCNLRKVIEDADDGYKEDRIKVRDFFYAAESQCASAQIILDKVNEIEK